MKRRLKKPLKVLGILSGILLILYIIVFAYVSANKKSIIKQVTEDISKKLNGKVAVGDVELSFIRTFPKVSVLLKNVTITDTMYAQHHHAFLQAQKLFAKLSVMKLIKKRICNQWHTYRKSICLFFYRYQRLYQHLLVQAKERFRLGGKNYR